MSCCRGRILSSDNASLAREYLTDIVTSLLAEVGVLDDDPSLKSKSVWLPLRTSLVWSHGLQ